MEWSCFAPRHGQGTQRGAAGSRDLRAGNLRTGDMVPAQHHSVTERSRAAFAMTLTEDSAIAAAAMIGDSRMPRIG